MRPKPRLVEAAKARGMPVLAICRGIQILNVALGGTLVQDISTQCKTDIAHDEDGPRDSRSHEIVVEPGSLIASAIGAERGTVNSFHHQSVKDVADGMRVTRRALPMGSSKAWSPLTKTGGCWQSSGTPRR